VSQHLQRIRGIVSGHPEVTWRVFRLHSGTNLCSPSLCYGRCVQLLWCTHLWSWPPLLLRPEALPPAQRRH
jgi:hypothetical protein